MSNHSESMSRVRNLLQLANRANSRLSAAAIGRHLEHLAADGYDRDRVVGAVEAVRDATLGLLMAVHTERDVRQCRAAAIRSADYLEAVLLLVSMPHEAAEPWSVAA